MLRRGMGKSSRCRSSLRRGEYEHESSGPVLILLDVQDSDSTRKALASSRSACPFLAYKMLLAATDPAHNRLVCCSCIISASRRTMELSSPITSTGSGLLDFCGVYARNAELRWVYEGIPWARNHDLLTQPLQA
jgi:hypothetical protein